MNQELYHEIEKYIHHIEWYSDFDIYLTCENFEEEYHTYMYTDGLCYYNYYLSLIFINKL